MEEMVIDLEAELHEEQKEAMKRALLRWFKDNKDRLELNNHDILEVIYDVGQTMKKEGWI